MAKQKPKPIKENIDVVTAKPKPTPEQRATLDRMKQAVQGYGKLEFQQDKENNTYNYKLNHNPFIDEAKAFETTGFLGFGLGVNLVQQASLGENPNHASRMMHDIAPQSPIEGLLATQMIATHALAMRNLQSAQNAEYMKSSEAYTNRAVKLLNCFTRHVETLHKLRNKGKQTITVQHVSVNDGGQAIIGNVAKNAEVHDRGEA